MVEVQDDAPFTTSKSDDSMPRESIPQGSSVTARSVTINKPRQELFDTWRDFSRLPSFMENVVRIDVIDQRRSHWVVKAPGGRTVEWDATVTDERPGEWIAWESAQDADVPNSGRVDFKDAGERGTVVTALIAYDPPAGIIGKVIAKLFQREPAIQARRDLRRFKQLMETGEVATSSRTHAQLEEETN